MDRVCPGCGRAIAPGDRVAWADYVPDPDRQTIHRVEAPLYHEACYERAKDARTLAVGDPAVTSTSGEVVADPVVIRRTRIPVRMEKRPGGFVPFMPSRGWTCPSCGRFREAAYDMVDPDEPKCLGCGQLVEILPAVTA